jgi:hypothetical protein
MKSRRRVRGGQVLGQDMRNTVHFSEDQRQVFGDRSGAYFKEGPAGNYSATPGMETAPDVENTMNPFRQPVDNTMQQLAPSALPEFPEGAPDAEAAMIDQAAMQMQGQGKPKKWIQGVVASMKKGAFTKQAKKAGMTPEQFADEVLGHSDKYSLTTRRRAQFLKNIRRGGMEADVEAAYAPGAGAAAAAAPARKKRGAFGTTGKDLMRLAAKHGEELPGLSALSVQRGKEAEVRERLARMRKGAKMGEAASAAKSAASAADYAKIVESGKAMEARRAKTIAEHGSDTYVGKLGERFTKVTPTIRTLREAFESTPAAKPKKKSAASQIGRAHV